MHAHELSQRRGVLSLFSFCFMAPTAVASLQQLEMSGDLVYYALGRRTNAQHSCTSARNLCPPCIMNNVCYQSQAECLCLQQL